MLSVLAILLFSIYLAFLFPLRKKAPALETTTDPKFDAQMKKLWAVAQKSMREHKPLRAEKALLTILKIDEKNAAAYNRLGIIYAKDKRYNEAIECFEIAESLDNNASSLHNAGLIYLETGAYEKASMAFKQALELEGDVPSRYIALAKAEEKLGQRKNAIENLESAYELDHSTATLRQILALYEAADDIENITATTARIEAQIAADSKRREEAEKSKRRTTRHRSPVRLVSRAVPRLRTARGKTTATTRASHAKTARSATATTSREKTATARGRAVATASKTARSAAPRTARVATSTKTNHTVAGRATASKTRTATKATARHPRRIQ